MVSRFLSIRCIVSSSDLLEPGEGSKSLSRRSLASYKTDARWSFNRIEAITSCLRSSTEVWTCTISRVLYWVAASRVHNSWP